MANLHPKTEQLIPNSQRTPKERSELARKMGIASGKARREKRTHAQKIDLVLERIGRMAAKATESKEQKEIIEELGIDYFEAARILVDKKSSKRDKLDAMKLLWGYKHGMPTQRQEISGPDGEAINITNFKDKTDEELQDLAREQSRDQAESE